MEEKKVIVFIDREFDQVCAIAGNLHHDGYEVYVFTANDDWNMYYLPKAVEEADIIVIDPYQTDKFHKIVIENRKDKKILIFTSWYYRQEDKILEKFEAVKLIMKPVPCEKMQEEIKKLLR